MSQIVTRQQIIPFPVPAAGPNTDPSAVYDYERLGPGSRVAGPAIVEAPLTTIVIPPRYQGAVDGYRNVIIT